MYELIKTINVNRANFEHIATTGNINGTLLIELARVMKEYHLQQLSLTEVCEHPFESVMSKCNGELNKCLKCGEYL